MGSDISMKPIIAVVCFAFVMLLQLPDGARGLQCYACDNEGSPEDCEENPSGISNGFVTCEPLEAENYCYTRRLEDTETGVITFNRGCCTIKVGSPVCPPGASDQWEYTETWESHKIRCKEDLCNTGKGDGTDNTGGDGDQGGAIIVNGRSSSAAQGPAAALKLHAKTAFIIILITKVVV